MRRGRAGLQVSPSPKMLAFATCHERGDCVSSCCVQVLSDRAPFSFDDVLCCCFRGLQRTALPGCMAARSSDSIIFAVPYAVGLPDVLWLATPHEVLVGYWCLVCRPCLVGSLLGVASMLVGAHPGRMLGSGPGHAGAVPIGWFQQSGMPVGSLPCRALHGSLWPRRPSSGVESVVPNVGPPQKSSTQQAADIRLPHPFMAA